jgi:hypothetical protein
MVFLVHVFFLGNQWYCVHGLHVMKPIEGLVNPIVNGPRGKR